MPSLCEASIPLAPQTHLDALGVTIRVGDEVEVLEAVPPGGGPIRPVS